MGALYSYLSSRIRGSVFAIAFRAPEIPDRGGVNESNGDNDKFDAFIQDEEFLK